MQCACSVCMGVCCARSIFEVCLLNEQASEHCDYG